LCSSIKLTYSIYIDGVSRCPLYISIFSSFFLLISLSHSSFALVSMWIWIIMTWWQYFIVSSSSHPTPKAYHSSFNRSPFRPQFIHTTSTIL
jgi:hypothetical protein